MTEATGLEARTIHRLLEVDPKGGGFKRNEERWTSRSCRCCCGPLLNRAALLLVGDIDQLPFVGPRQVLADVIGCETVPVVRLTDVFRQAAQSRIITSAHFIAGGALPDLSNPGCMARSRSS